WRRYPTCKTSGEGGIRRSCISCGNPAILGDADAESDAVTTDFELARLIAAWLTLPSSVKAALMALVERKRVRRLRDGAIRCECVKMISLAPAREDADLNQTSDPCGPGSHTT